MKRAYKEAISRQYIYDMMLESGQNPVVLLHPKKIGANWSIVKGL